MKNRRLSRNISHRKALLSNLACSLFKHERIQTTQAKAKEIIKVADKLITLSKAGDLASRRQVLKVIKDKEVVKKMFSELASRFNEVHGGYTRIIKCGPRQGDAAQMAIVKLTG